MRCKAGGSYHDHLTVEDTRRCWQAHYSRLSTPPVTASPPAPVTPPPPPPPVAPPAPAVVPVNRRGPAWWYKPVTDSQLDKIEKLGGDAHHARKLLRKEASDYIERLMKEPRPVASTPAAPQPRPWDQNDPQLKMVKGLIDMVPEGNYATAPQGENRHSDFIRITRPTSGKLKGKLHVQTRHADTLKTRIIGHENGYWEFERGGWKLIPMLMEIIQDYKTCAMRYSIEAVACSHCATPLTDDRSRHYLVGPICEKVHGYTWPVEFADEWNGATFEELQAAGKEFKQHHQAFLDAA